MQGASELLLVREQRWQGERRLLLPKDVQHLPKEGQLLLGELPLQGERENRLLAKEPPREKDVLLSLAEERLFAGGKSLFWLEESVLPNFAGEESWQLGVAERQLLLHEEERS